MMDGGEKNLQFVGVSRNVWKMVGCSSSKGCIDDLFLLEEESGNFLNAAMIARSWGDLSKEANLLEKAGEFQEVAMCLIWYVLFRVAWGDGNRGWPLKQFDQMEEICNKVKSLAKRISKGFYEFVCSELKAITTEYYPKQNLKGNLQMASAKQKQIALRAYLQLWLIRDKPVKSMGALPNLAPLP
ncbi:hypothetical protein Tco_1501658 [Tanacetum coccineum]